MLPSSFRCPRCKCGACYALHRKGFDWVMYLLGLRPVRCLTCGKRFYARYSVAGDRLKIDGKGAGADGEPERREGLRT